METRTSKRGRGGKNSSAQKHSTTPPAQADGHSRPTMSMLTPRKHSEQSPALELPVLHYGSADDRDSPPSLTMVHQQVIEFQKCVQDAMDLLLKGMRKLENDLGASIEYQSRRITDLEGRLQPLEAQNRELKKEITMIQDQLAQQHVNIHNQERFSRRNNFRLVGVPIKENEDCVKYVEDLLCTKFKMDGVHIERAHRVGRGAPGKSPHIIVKVLSYRDKVNVMKSARTVLQDSRAFIVDDLTKQDLDEKIKWSAKVKELYGKNIKLSFSAGKWRKDGQPYAF